MTRQEILQWMVLEIEGELDPAQVELLERELERSAELRLEREQLHEVWSTLRQEAQELRLPADFGQEQVAEWTRPRPEGVLFATPMAIAASLLFMIGLYPALGGPVAVGLSTVADEALSHSSDGVAVEVGSVWDGADGPWKLSLDGGRDLELKQGRVAVESARSFKVEVDEPTFVTVRLGPGATEVEVGDVTLFGRRATFDVRRSANGELRLDVHEGHVRMRDASGATLLSPGSSVLIRTPRGNDGFLGGEDQPSIDPIRHLDPPPPGDTLLPPESDDLSGDEGFDEDAESEERQSTNSDESRFEPAHLFGRVGSENRAFGVGGVEVLLERVGFPMKVAADYAASDQDVDRAPWRHSLLEASQDELERSLRAVTSEGGCYCIDGIPPGFWRLRFLSGDRVLADRAPQHLRLAEGETREFNAVLDHGHVQTGSVEGADGRPVEGAKIESMSQSVRTDSSGRFELPGSRPRLRVFVDAEGHLPVSLRLGRGHSDDTVHLESGQQIAVDVQSVLGTAIGDARVVAEWAFEGRRIQRVARPGPGTSQWLSGLPMREVQLLTSAPGHECDRRLINPSRSFAFNIELRPSRLIDGSVRDRQDRGLEGVAVHLLGGEQALPLRSETQAEGHLHFGDAAIGMPYRGFLDLDGYRARGVRVGRGSDLGTRVLRLDESGRRLRVLDPFEKEIDSAWALWVVVDETRRRWVQVRVLKTDERGGFELPHAESSLYERGLAPHLLVGAPGHAVVELIDAGTDEVFECRLDAPAMDR